MTPSWLPALAFALGAILAFEVPMLLFGRELKARWLRAAFHLWALVTGGLVFLLESELLLDWPRLWQGLGVASLTLGALVGYHLLVRFLLRRPPTAGAPPPAPKLVRDVVGWLLVLGAFMAGLAAFGVTKLTALVVSSTVISAVVGLALQDVLKNLIAAMALQSERAFSSGDWLLLDGRPTRVVDMSWRITHLRDSEGHDLFEPNAALVTQRLTNLGTGERPVGWSVRVGLPYAAPPQQVKAALLAAARGAPGVADEPPPRAFLESYGESAIQYRLRVWTREVDHLLRFADGVNSRIWYQLQREGLSIPFPIRTVELHDMAAERAEREAAERARCLARIDGVALFAALAPEHRERLAAAARRLHYDDGERLVEEGEPGDSLMVIDRGRVRISKRAVDPGSGSGVLLATLGEGEFFGEMSLLTGEPRSATVVGLGGCEVLVLDREAVAPLLAVDPAVAETLSRLLAARVEATAASLESRRERDAKALPEETDSGPLLRRIRALFGLDRR
jgi:small-conductance mechanosensitive channel/CRP-like cAMP-binding protein